MEVEKIEGDGNCLYRAITQQINRLLGLTFTYQSVRKDLATYVYENRLDTDMRNILTSNATDTFRGQYGHLTQTAQIEMYIQKQFEDKF